MDTQTPEFFVVTTVISAASAIAASLSFYYNRKTNKLTSIVKAFEILNDNAHRNARIRLYRCAEIRDETARDAHFEALGVKKESRRTIIKESENIVLADFDQMGTLVNNKLLPGDEFLRVYWNTIISTYEVLGYTKDKRELYGDFKYLYVEAMKVRLEKDPYKQIPLEKEIYREKLEVKVNLKQSIAIGDTQKISVTVRDPIFDPKSGWVTGAKVVLDVFDNDSNLHFHSLDPINTDKNGSADFPPFIIDTECFKNGKNYVVKVFVSAQGYRDSESEDDIFFMVT